MMNDNSPSAADKLVIFRAGDELPLAETRAEPDPEMLEIVEAKKRFNGSADAESFWAGRLLANRKSTRIAA